MDIYVDCRERTFGFIPPVDLEGRQVIAQSIPATLPTAAVCSLLNAMHSQSDQGINLVYKITVAQ